MADRFDKFSERARRVLSLSQEEAQRLGQNFIGSEHLLLGLVREGEGVAGQVLSAQGIDIDRCRSAVESASAAGEPAYPNAQGLNTQAKRVIELAVDEARRINHGYIGTEHLLLGLVREKDSVAARALLSLGTTSSSLRAAVMAKLEQNRPASAGHAQTQSTPGTRMLGPSLEGLRLAKEQAIREQRYELAAALRDQVEQLERILNDIDAGKFPAPAGHGAGDEA